MATPSQRFFSPSATLTGSGIPVSRPITTYTPNPMPSSTTLNVTARSNYPTNSNIDSRESLAARPPPLGAYRYIETAGAVTYRPVNLPGDQQRAPQRPDLPDVHMEMGANGMHVPYRPREQHPGFTTTNNELGAQQPSRFVTEEYRYYPRAHTFTNTFGGSGNYRSFGLSTSHDEARVHRFEAFSNP